MATLLLTFNNPLQSWGTSLKLKDHDTDVIPSKSAVIGMVASAMGIRRDDDAGIARLSKMRFGVRVDSPGEIMRDWQVAEYDEKKAKKKIGNRYYLSDAEFTCGLEADRNALERISQALRHPANALFLGRRSCPVTADLVGDILDLSLEEALKKTAKQQDRIIVETTETTGVMVRDVPISFSFENRRYGFRFRKEI